MTGESMTYVSMLWARGGENDRMEIRFVKPDHRIETLRISLTSVNVERNNHDKP